MQSLLHSVKITDTKPLFRRPISSLVLELMLGRG
jgi:hypothetical protein